MESFFFVPGTRLHKISDIQKLNVSQIIIDLEDAVKVSEREEILNKLCSDNSYCQFFIRIPLYNQNEILDNSIFKKLYENGFRNFIFPKIQKVSDFDEIYSDAYQDLKIILLVETTRFFLEVKEVLLKHKKLFFGIGIGSHDFMSEVGGVHDLKNLEYVRLQILYLARMIHIKAIDIASMELKNENSFREEIQDGLHKGYDAKFFIHPFQISIFKSLSLYSENEYNWAQKIMNEFSKVESASEFNPIIIDGQIIERPHLAKAKKIIEYYASK